MDKVLKDAKLTEFVHEFAKRFTIFRIFISSILFNRTAIWRCVCRGWTFRPMFDRECCLWRY